MEDKMQIDKSLEESGLLIKKLLKQLKMKKKKQNGGYLSMLLGELAASILRNALSGSGAIRAGDKNNQSWSKKFWCCLIIYLIFKYKTIIRNNLNVILFIQEII